MTRILGISGSLRAGSFNTALLRAAINGRLEMVQWLLKNGASVAEKNKAGDTALLLAATN